MRRTFMLRDILLLTIGSLTLLIAVLVGQDTYAEWQKLARIHMFGNAMILGDQLFDVGEKLSVERDIAFSMIFANEKGMLGELQNRLHDSRKDVDNAFLITFDGLKNYHFDERLAESAIDIKTVQLKRLRDQIDHEMALPIAERNNAFSKQWFAEATSTILQTQNIWMDFVKHFSDVDAPMMLGIRLKYILGNIMDYSGRQRAVIGHLLAENVDATPREQSRLLRWQGVLEIEWDMENSLAQQTGLSGAIQPYLDDARSHYSTLYDMVRDIFYVPGAHHGASYPIDAAFWLDLASQATDSLNTLKSAVLKQNRIHIQRLEAQAQRSIFYHSLFLLFAVGLCGYSLWVVLHRVIRPVNAMVEALVSASEGKPVTIAPPTYSRQDEIGKLAFVLHAFQQSTDEVKRTNAALNESENKLHQAQKMEAIGSLTGGMAHDFNNLLGVIIGNLDILLEQVDKNDGQKQLAQAALDAALRGADLTRRLLAFARQQPLQPQRIETNALVEGITKLLSRMLGENIEIALNLGSGIWPIIADPSQLEAAITNLAANARDAMPKGGKLIVTTLNGELDADYAREHEDVRAGDYVVIEVSDTGTGMPPEVVARIFEPFYTTKERGKGTGLGLAMVFGFMKQSGGHINVYSEVGSGTTFRLYLPRAAAGVSSIVQNNVLPRAAGGHETILVVEDNEAMRNIVVRQLGELGYRVLEATNAIAGLEILEAGKGVDLLFTDIVMPGKLDGMELARQALRRWPSLKVMLTSGFPENKLNGQIEPITGIRLLSKPYRKEDLARALRQTLDQPMPAAGNL